MAAETVEAMLRGMVDYAGMFPPAGLTLGDATAVYARHRDSAEAWLVGSFVVAAERLADLDPATGPLSVAVAATSPAALEPVLRTATRMTMTALEFRPVRPREIAALAAAVPAHIQAFFEVPPDDEVDRQLDAIAACGAAAKIRTGGLTPDAFPSAPAIYRFLRACADRHIPAKATAGLHHAVTGRYPLTYEAGSASGGMYGFLNVSAAAALVHTGSSRDDVLAVLEESSPGAFQFDEDRMGWRGRQISTNDVRAMRQTLFRSFGSCSLREPIDELKRMQLI
jgi:hypothetical protein